MNIEILLDQSDMDMLRSGISVAKAIKGNVVTIIYEPTMTRDEYFEKRFGVEKKP